MAPIVKKNFLQVFKLFTNICIYIIYIQLLHHVGVTKMLGLESMCLGPDPARQAKLSGPRHLTEVL